MTPEVTWGAAQRLESLAGEARVNLVRLAALAGFYANHLASVYFFRDDPGAAGRYHANVTVVVLAWLLAILLVHACIAARWVPDALKYVAAGWDVLLITVLLMVGKTPASMLAVLYFLAIASATLRLSLPLVYATTLASMAGYLLFLGYLRFGLNLPASERLARPQQVIVLLALGGAGVLAGQVVRQCRRIVRGYPEPAVEEQTRL